MEGAPEGFGPSTYGDAFADVYDDWYGDTGAPGSAGSTADAVDRLVGLAAGGRVLELGVGTGRLAVPLAARGVEVHGIEGSRAMLERLRAKPGADRVRSAPGDFADVGAEGLFAVVVASYNTFFTLPSEGEQRRCMGNVAAHLAPGGRFVVETFVPDPDAPAAHVEPRRVEIDHVVLLATLVDREAQIVRNQHVTLSAGGTRLRPSFLRYATPEQLDEMAAGAGLRLECRHAGWRQEPFTEDSPVHVSVYRLRG